MYCKACGTANSEGATFCSNCSAPLLASAVTGDATGGVIPYKNPPALTAYYLGLFSALPLIGFFLGVASVTLGWLGLKKKKETPQVKGSAHAWIGIGCGTLGILVWGAAIVMMIFAAVSQ